MMSDVVSQLKLTSKGQLKYADWSPVELLQSTTQQTLSIDPFSIKAHSKLLKQENATNKLSNDYETYFSPERRKKDPPANTKASKTNKLSITKTSINHAHEIAPSKNTEVVITPFGDKLHSTTLNTTVEKLITDPKTNLLRKYDDDFAVTLTTLKNLRLKKFQENLKEINNEYQEKVDEINDLQKKKFMYEVEMLKSEEKKITAEMEIYKSYNEQKNIYAEEKIQQAEKQRKEIELRVQKSNEEKRLRQEKIKILGQLSQPANNAVATVKALYQKCKVAGYDIPQNFIQLMSAMLKEYNECVSIISTGVNSPGLDLDTLVQQATAKVTVLENLTKSCEHLVLDLEKKKEESEKIRHEAEEKAQKEASEKAAAASAAAAAAAAKTVAATQPLSSSTALNQTKDPSDQQDQVPKLPDNLSIASIVPALAPLESTLRSVLTLCVPKSAFNEYIHLQKMLQDTIKQHEPVSKSTDKAIKTYKFDIYKVINTTINAISDESPKHLLDKIMKINTLLTGKEIELGGKKITIKNSKYGMALAKELLAKKIVLQGAQQVAASFKTVFPIAAFATGVWVLFPDVGELLLAHFHSNCPFVVPFYIPKSKEMSTSDYCKLVGYDVDGNEIESEDKYLKKISGIVRLYAAILQTELPPQLGSRNHPHGLDHGWIWFTRLLNLEPRPSVTATVIYDFLEVAGHAMLQRFGSQFLKVLRVLCDSYMPKILSVIGNESKAAEMRLKMFLDEVIKSGKVKEPEGRITLRWWNTGHH